MKTKSFLSILSAVPACIAGGLASLALVGGLSSCAFDDTELQNSIDDLTSRVEALEDFQEQVQGDITSLQDIVEKLGSSVTVNNVVDNGDGSWTINFSDGTSVTIRNGQDGEDGLIHHSDRGCQYCCEKYVKLLQDNGMMISMTECGNPRENAIAERVNGILKSEWLNDERFSGISDARIRIAEVIDIYNNKRPHLSLGYATPAQASLMVGEQTRKWKNYYKTKESPEKTEEIILSLTSDVRTNLQTSGL